MAAAEGPELSAQEMVEAKQKAERKAKAEAGECAYVVVSPGSHKTSHPLHSLHQPHQLHSSNPTHHIQPTSPNHSAQKAEGGAACTEGGQEGRRRSRWGNARGGCPC